MAAQYYCADTQDGYHIDDPSHAALVVLISELNHIDNTFVRIQPDEDDPAWYASVSLRDDDTYYVELRDIPQGDHHFRTQTDPRTVAHDVSLWLAARDHPNP